jgi:hypothetical protein
MATDTRKLGKGHEGLNNACLEMPLAQTYHLVEKIQELARRQVRAARLAKQKKWLEPTRTSRLSKKEHGISCGSAVK